jgi:hypothetical protein
VAESTGAGLAWLLFVGSSVHVVSTGWLFTAKEMRAQARRHRHRYLWAPLGLIAVAATLAAALPTRTVNVLLLGYFGWQFWHYQRQNYGIAALAASAKRVASLTGSERHALLITGCTGGTGLLVHPGLLQLTLPLGLVRALQPAFPLVGIAFLLGGSYGIAALAHRPAGQRPVTFCAHYLMGLLFFAPVFLFRSPYAAVGTLVIVHGMQYLVLTGLVATGDRRQAARLRALVVMVGLALVAGAALNLASHLHSAGPTGRLLYGVYLGVVMTHFVFDAASWRLRDPSCRAFIASRVPRLFPARLADASDTDIRSAA